ncbi:MAG: TFIIB-type zinc ribbon-containing protein [Acidianus sp.]|jgi:transcription initiation factor TFIIIB Brf1 subunit/transcription initiation factor TFIIB|nr:TFIIB-type zinc ribbon-containing protein [Acidianus sp.]
MQCPYCNSKNLIWDSIHGNIICASCGSVIDTLYDYSQIGTSEEIIDLNKGVSERKETRNFIRLTETISNKFRIFNNKENMKFITEDGELALSLLNMDKKVYKIYEFLEKNGMFSGRKIKIRVALSFYIAGYRCKKMKNILEKLHINEKYFRKITYKLPKELKYMNKELLD